MKPFFWLTAIQLTILVILSQFLSESVVRSPGIFVSFCETTLANMFTIMTSTWKKSFFFFLNFVSVWTHGSQVGLDIVSSLSWLGDHFQNDRTLWPTISSFRNLCQYIGSVMKCSKFYMSFNVKTKFEILCEWVLM
jgi:hypothetical protein